MRRLLMAILTPVLAFALCLVVPAGPDAFAAPPPLQHCIHLLPTWIRAKDDLQLERARDIDARCVRLGASWRLLDESWYLPALERVVDKALELGLGVYLMLADPPRTATLKPSTNPDPDCRDSEGKTVYAWRAPKPKKYREYARALADLAERFQGRVTFFEVWNEPNHCWFWGGKPNAKAYVSLLKVTYAEVKTKNPKAIVLGGSLAGTDRQYASKMYALGAREFMDRLAVHPYTGNRGPYDCSVSDWSLSCADGSGGLQAIHGIMLENGDHRPILVTEFGWSSCQRFSEHQDCVSKKEQARFLTRAFRALASLGYVRMATWHVLLQRRTEPGVDERERHFGLFRENSSTTAKPAASAFARVAPP